MKTRAELKAQAKQVLDQHFWKTVGLACIFPILAFLLSYLPVFPGVFAQNSNIMLGITSVLMLLVIGINAIINMIGSQLQLFVIDEWTVKQNYAGNISLLWKMTKKYAWGTICLYIVQSFFILLWSLLLVIPGLIKAISYSQAFLIYKDKVAAGETQISYRACLKESMALMDGHKWEFFVFQLSYIWWILLCIVTFGIASLWVIPYMQAGNIQYYLNLKESQDTAK